MVEMEREDRRKKIIAMSDDEYPFVSQDGVLSFIPAGRYGDHIIGAARCCEKIDEFDSMKIRNRDGLQRYWAKHKDDALSVNAELEKIRGAFAGKAA
jgi:hypothetical protein